MIPKIIHCVWLSGEEKPDQYQKCLDSWKARMPDYEIKEWSLKNLPSEVIEHPYVKSALMHRKWAFATDYIRVWALYNYGGIYMDLDVYVFKSFDSFTNQSAFADLEFYPVSYVLDIRKRNLNISGALNIDAAVLGSIKRHPWIKDILTYYEDKIFINSPDKIKHLIMPTIISKVSLKYGFKYLPVYQVLDNNVTIYPTDVFSSYTEYDKKVIEENIDHPNVIKYSSHLCAHGWCDIIPKKDRIFLFKKGIAKIIGLQNAKKIKAIFKGNNMFVNPD